MSSYGIAVILVSLVVVIAWLAFRRCRHRRCRRDRFSYVSPATPLARDAVSEVLSGIDAAATAAKELPAAAVPALVGSPEVVQQPVGAVSGSAPDITMLTSSLGTMRKALEQTPPTYASYLAFYRGISGSDAAIGRAAEAYRREGLARLTREPGDPTGPALIAFARSLRCILGGVHRLGAALAVE